MLQERKFFLSVTNSSILTLSHIQELQAVCYDDGRFSIISVYTYRLHMGFLEPMSSILLMEVREESGDIPRQGFGDMILVHATESPPYPILFLPDMPLLSSFLPMTCPCCCFPWLTQPEICVNSFVSSGWDWSDGSALHIPSPGILQHWDASAVTLTHRIWGVTFSDALHRRRQRLV